MPPPPHAHLPPTISLPPTPHPPTHPPQTSSFPSHHLVIGAGVAIFHLATARVVLCYHSRDRYWFLPKGRRDVGETTACAAEREGFEESGYRNRLLPLPIPHRQPTPQGERAPVFSTEPVWMQMLPASRRTQYLLFWYVAETVPPGDDLPSPPPPPPPPTTAPAPPASASLGASTPYAPPPPYPSNLTLRDRIAQEGSGYEPRRHEGTGVDEEEALYESYLVPVGEAVGRLGGHVMGEVVRRGWEGVVGRLGVEEMELEEEKEGDWVEEGG